MFLQLFQLFICSIVSTKLQQKTGKNSVSIRSSQKLRFGQDDEGNVEHVLCSCEALMTKQLQQLKQLIVEPSDAVQRLSKNILAFINVIGIHREDKQQGPITKYLVVGNNEVGQPLPRPNLIYRLQRMYNFSLRTSLPHD